MRVIDNNACRHCRRPIEKLEDIGWVHGELPQYAGELITCERPQPVDPRCLICDELVPAMAIGGGQMKLSRHGTPTCAGSGTRRPRPE